MNTIGVLLLRFLLDNDELQEQTFMIVKKRKKKNQMFRSVSVVL
jgi:hypothetical protein